MKKPKPVKKVVVPKEDQPHRSGVMDASYLVEAPRRYVDGVPQDDPVHEAMALGFQVGTVVRVLKRTDVVKKGAVMKIVRITVGGVCTLQPTEGTGTAEAPFKNLEMFAPLVDKTDVKKAHTEDVKAGPPIDWVMMAPDHGAT